MTPSVSRSLRNTATVFTWIFAVAALASYQTPALMAFALWAASFSALQAWYFRLQSIEEAAAAYAQKKQQNSSSSIWSIEDERGRPLNQVTSIQSYQQRGQWIALALSSLLPLLLLWRSLPPPSIEFSPSSLPLRIAVALSLSVILHLLGRYARVLCEKLEQNSLSGLLHLARLGSWLSLLWAAVQGILLVSQRDFRSIIELISLGTTLILIVEAWLMAIFRFMKPADLRAAAGPIDGSFLLGTLFHRKHPLEEMSERVEASLGIHIQDTWAFQFVKRSIAPLLLMALALAWASTMATVVPVGHSGVRIRLGHFLEELAEPGLHWSLPWPLEQIALIPTAKIEELILGFEKDSGEPILWTERHYEGEKNLLVGNGDELLTISVPVQYRIRDPLAYLMSTTESRAALEHLAYRELLRVTSARDSFAVMTDERAEVSEALHQGLQAAADAQQLGLEIVWVGLRDIHPPVDVTSAYQDVISAEEERQTLVEQARAYRAARIPTANMESNRLRVMSTAAGKERVLLASGEALRFEQLAAAQQAHSELFRFRYVHESMVAAWGAPSKLLLVTDSLPGVILDSRQQEATASPWNGNL